MGQEVEVPDSEEPVESDQEQEEGEDAEEEVLPDSSDELVLIKADTG